MQLLRASRSLFLALSKAMRLDYYSDNLPPALPSAELENAAIQSRSPLYDVV